MKDAIPCAALRRRGPRHAAGIFAGVRGGEKSAFENRHRRKQPLGQLRGHQNGREFLGGFSSKTAMIIGAGEMGELTVRNLVSHGISTSM